MGSNWQPPPGLLDGVGGQPASATAAAAQVAAAALAWADPRSLHHAGRRSDGLLAAARRSIADSVSAAAGTTIHADEVYFTPSALAAQTFALAGCPGPAVMSAVETAALLDLGDLREHSQVIGVDALGRVDVAAFGQAAGGKAIAALQLANSEVGTCQPIEQVVAANPALPILMDATGGLGRIQLPTGWAMLTAGAGGWAGPAGVAILVVRRGGRWVSPPASERGLLGGFADIPGAVGAATALAELSAEQDAQHDQAFANIELLRAGIATKIADVEVLGDGVWRLPHILTFSVLYVSGEALVLELDKRGFAVASGSACVAEEARPSHVLAAMGAYTGGNIRISLPLGCTTETVVGFLDALPDAVAAVRADN